MSGPDTSEVDVTVVVAAKNAARFLPDQLQALATQDVGEPFEVVVADNGSTDSTREIAASFNDRLARLRVIDASDRPGSAYARNRGVAEAVGSRLVFADADDVVDAAYVGTLATALKQNDVVAARIDWQMLNRSGSGGLPTIQTTGVTKGFFGWLPFSMGGAMGVRRQAFDAVGGFEECVPRADDVEFCWRLGLAGYSVAFVPEAVVHYRLRTGVRQTFLQNRANGRDGPWLYQRYRASGMPRHHGRAAVSFWLGPLRAFVRCRSRSDLIGCASLLGIRIGMIEGCLRYRVLYF